MAAPKTADLIEGVNKNIAELVDVVKSVAQRVEALEKPADLGPNKPEEQPVVIERTYNPASSRHRELINTMLNKHFDFKIETSTNPANFRFIVYVPQKYSTASAGHWAMYHEDACIGEITVSMGEDGIKDHLKRVFKLFNPDVQAQVVADR